MAKHGFRSYPLPIFLTFEWLTRRSSGTPELREAWGSLVAAARV